MTWVCIFPPLEFKLSDKLSPYEHKSVYLNWMNILEAKKKKHTSLEFDFIKHPRRVTKLALENGLGILVFWDATCSALETKADV